MRIVNQYSFLDVCRICLMKNCQLKVSYDPKSACREFGDRRFGSEEESAAIQLSVLTKSVSKAVSNNTQYDCSVLWREHIAFSAHVLTTYITNNRLKWVRIAGGVPSQLYWVPAKCHNTWNRLNQRNIFHNVKVRDRGYVFERVIFNGKLGDRDRFGHLKVNESLTL